MPQVPVRGSASRPVCRRPIASANCFTSCGSPSSPSRNTSAPRHVPGAGLIDCLLRSQGERPATPRGRLDPGGGRGVVLEPPDDPARLVDQEVPGPRVHPVPRAHGLPGRRRPGRTPSSPGGTRPGGHFGRPNARRRRRARGPCTSGAVALNPGSFLTHRPHHLPQRSPGAQPSLGAGRAIGQEVAVGRAQRAGRHRLVPRVHRRLCLFILAADRFDLPL